jgi:perosamine synthetase
MRRTLFTSLSPNLEWDDVWCAVRQLIRPWRWQEERATKTLEDKFRTWFVAPFAFAFASGRTCLYAILQTLNLHAEDEVLLQAYTCVAVPNPILWTGAKPVYVDCDPKTLTLSLEDLRRKITTRSKVLIIQHTLGQAAHLNELLALAREHHLFVIEDCAHALGGRYNGQLLGSFGDASFFSFGRDKVLSSVFGGMLLVKDNVLAGKIQSYQASLPFPRTIWVMQQLLHPLLTGFAKATYDFGLGKILLAFGRKTHLISQPVEPQEKQGQAPSFAYHRLSGALSPLACHQLTKLERFHAHRIKLAQKYAEALRERACKLPEPVENSTPAWLRYTIQTPRAVEIRAEAKREGIYLGDWYTTSIAPQGVDYTKVCYDSCPTAEQIARETVNLPTDIHITSEDADRIIHFMYRFV